MRAFRGKLMAGDQVILSPVGGFVAPISDSISGGYRGEIHVSPEHTSALYKADRLDIDGGPMFDISVPKIRVGSHASICVAEFESNGIPLRM